MGNQPVGIALIGAGHWGPNLIRNFYEHELSEVKWVVDREPGRLSEVKSRFPDIHLSTEEDDALEDDEVDAVVIATPTSTHFELARAALDRGKHVLVEKPITNKVSDAEQLCEIAERRGLVLLTGHVFIYNGAVERVREYISAGELGRIFYIAMVRTNLGPIRMDVNSAWDLASHDLSIANYWLGTEPVTVSAQGGTWINSGIDDAVFATLRYPSGILLNLHASWLNPRKTRDVTVVGDRRMLTFNDLDLTEPIRIYDKGVSEERVVPAFVDTFASFRASVRDGDITIPHVSLGEPLRTECSHFLECIVQGKEPLTGGRFGTSVVRALEAMELSMRRGGREEEIASHAKT